MREYKTILFGVQSHVCLSSRPEGNSFKTLLTLQRTRARQTLMQRGEREQLPVCPSFWFEVFWKKSPTVFKAWFSYLPLRKQTMWRENIWYNRKQGRGRYRCKVSLTLLVKKTELKGVIWYRLWQATKRDAKIASPFNPTYYQGLE